MKHCDFSNIQRALGIIEGVACASEDTVSIVLGSAVTLIGDALVNYIPKEDLVR